MNYLPSSAESMIRYLKSIAVRNSIYKDLHKDYLNRCHNEITNFVDIFSEYPVSFEVTNDPIRELFKKKEIIGKVTNVPTLESIELKEGKIKIKRSLIRKKNKNTQRYKKL